jgi:hypothetical protein
MDTELVYEYYIGHCPFSGVYLMFIMFRKPTEFLKNVVAILYVNPTMGKV